jgi:hypothetical protein
MEEEIEEGSNLENEEKQRSAYADKIRALEVEAEKADAKLTKPEKKIRMRVCLDIARGRLMAQDNQLKVIIGLSSFNS